MAPAGSTRQCGTGKGEPGGGHFSRDGQGSDDMDLTRRDMMKLGALGVAGAAGASQLPLNEIIEARATSLLALGNMPKVFTTQFMRPPILHPTHSRRDRNGVVTDFFTVRESARRARILPTKDTVIFGYNGMAPGPTIKTHRGRPAVLRVINQLPSVHPSLGQTTETSVHLHGSASLPQYDGYASDVTRDGWFKDYHYPNIQPARTLWYHDHGFHHTAE